MHLLDGQHSAQVVAGLLTELSRRYAEVLDAPIERVRAFVTLHPVGTWATAGAIAGESAPYFTALVLAGRPVEQRQRLLASFTDALVDQLGVRRELVRGQIVPIEPEDWAIGGVPASAARRDEMHARTVAAESGR